MDVDEFLEKVKVDREVGYKCEYEVTKKAMESYCKYPNFEAYKYELIDKKKGYRLKNESNVWIADILTSIKSPINKLIEGEKYNKKTRGIDIVNDILSDSTMVDENYKPYIKMFAMVYYSRKYVERANLDGIEHIYFVTIVFLNGIGFLKADFFVNIFCMSVSPKIGCG